MTNEDLTQRVEKLEAQLRDLTAKVRFQDILLDLHIRSGCATPDEQNQFIRYVIETLDAFEWDDTDVQKFAGSYLNHLTDVLKQLEQM